MYGYYIEASTNNCIRIATRMNLKFEDSNVGRYTHTEFLNQMKISNISLVLTPIEHVSRTTNLRKSTAT